MSFSIGSTSQYGGVPYRLFLKIKTYDVKCNLIRRIKHNFLAHLLNNICFFQSTPVFFFLVLFCKNNMIRLPSQPIRYRLTVDTRVARISLSIRLFSLLIMKSSLFVIDLIYGSMIFLNNGHDFID